MKSLHVPLRSVIAVLAAATVFGVSSEASAEAAHNYIANEGLDYGYPAAISQNDRMRGQVAQKILMFKYAGQRDGRHQVHSTDGIVVTALECTSPCEVVKMMTFVDSDYLRRTVRVERISYQRGSLAAAVLDDAIGGKLHQYGMQRGSKAYQVWVEEGRGFREYAVAKPK